MSAVIRALREQGRQAPARLALADLRQSLTFGNLVDAVERRSHELRQLGSRVVGLLADNGIDWALTDLAALAAGITLVPIPPWFTFAQRRHVIEASGMDTFITDCEPGSATEMRGFGRPVSRVGRFIAYQDMPKLHAEPPTSATIAKITFTSGSTGQPKGVRLAQATVDQVAGRLESVLAGLKIEQHLCVMPLATLLENVAGLYVPLMLGTAVQVPSTMATGLTGSSGFDAHRLRGTSDATRAQSLILTPQLLRSLTDSYRDDGIRSECLRFVAVGGARVSKADLDAAWEVGIPAYQGYGLSECASVVALNRPGDDRPGSVGRPLPGVTVNVAVDGTIRVGNQCMHGYLGDPDSEVAVVETGDLGYLDEDGFLYVTGRRKNLFITSYGRNVTPEWPESELVAQPEIAQACVFGDGRATNTAVLVPAGINMRGDALAHAVKRANAALPDYARIADWVVADEPFSPANGMATATGKARRQVIEDRYLPKPAPPAMAL